MRKTLLFLALFLINGVLLAGQSAVDGFYSIAGVLNESNFYSNGFTFKSKGGEILFVAVDALLFRGQADEGGHDEGEGEDGGCSGGGGSAAVVVEVLDRTNNAICRATRPRSPGWQRDPRLACILPYQGKMETFTLRISFRTGEGGSDSFEEDLPYLLNYSLRGIATEGSLALATVMSMVH